MEGCMIQLVQCDARLNSGAITNAGDWPGFFFRGDELPTLELRMAARVLRGEVVNQKVSDALAKSLDRICDRMATCIVDERVA